MPLPELTILSGCPPLRRGRMSFRRRRQGVGCVPRMSRGMLGVGNIGKKRRHRKKCLGINLALQNSVHKGTCKQVGKRKVCRSKSGRAYIGYDTKGRRHFENGKFYHPTLFRSGTSGLLGNLLGGTGVKKRKIKRSKGRTLASLLRVGRGKCKRAGVTKRSRKVCRTKRGKGFIKIDTKHRKHSVSGRLLPMSGFGMGGIGSTFSTFGRSRRIMAYRPKRRRVGRSSAYRRGGFGLGELTVPASVKSFLPPINKDSLIKSAKIIGGAVAPITIQNMVVPATWRVGFKGLLSYTLIGGGLIFASNKVGVLRSSSNEISQGVVLGFVFQVIQNYVLKRTLIPVASTKGVTALKGVDACASCHNADGCGDVGDCIGYVGDNENVGDVGNDEGVGDYVQVGDDGVDGIEDVSDYIISGSDDND